MIPFDEMPDDNAKLAEIPIEFPVFQPNDASSCPVTIEEIVDYLRIESPDGEDVEADQLHFLRTAVVAEQKYWIWFFEELDETKCFATVALSPDGTACLGYDENYYGLTPEQFMLGEYHNVF